MFRFGDRIRVKENGLTGTILNTYDSVELSGARTPKVSILWDHQNNGHTYNMSEVLGLWETVGSVNDQQIGVDYAPANVNDRLPTGMYPFIGIDPAFAPKPECDHKWVEAGFTFSKIVCKHCDKEKVE